MKHKNSLTTRFVFHVALDEQVQVGTSSETHGYTIPSPTYLYPWVHRTIFRHLGRFVMTIHEG